MIEIEYYALTKFKSCHPLTKKLQKLPTPENKEQWSSGKSTWLEKSIRLLVGTKKR